MLQILYQSLKSNFISLETLQELLAEIAINSTAKNVKVRLEIIHNVLKIKTLSRSL